MAKKDTLHILWTNDNIITSEKMVFMYSIRTMEKGLWDNMTIILWGATIKLAAESEKIQGLIRKAMDAGIHVSGCRSCAEELGVVEDIEKHGIELIRWGAPLTQLIKDNEALLTI